KCRAKDYLVSLSLGNLDRNWSCDIQLDDSKALITGIVENLGIDSSVCNNITAGPAPDRYAAYPRLRRRLTHSAVTGSTSERYGWCKRSRVPSHSKSG